MILQSYDIKWTSFIHGFTYLHFRCVSLSVLESGALIFYHCLNYLLSNPNAYIYIWQKNSIHGRSFTVLSFLQETFLSDLRALNPELCVTAAYGNILPNKFLEIPPCGTQIVWVTNWVEFQFIFLRIFPMSSDIHDACKFILNLWIWNWIIDLSLVT